VGQHTLHYWPLCWLRENWKLSTIFGKFTNFVIAKMSSTVPQIYVLIKFSSLLSGEGFFLGLGTLLSAFILA